VIVLILALALWAAVEGDLTCTHAFEGRLDLTVIAFREDEMFLIVEAPFLVELLQLKHKDCVAVDL